MPLKLKKKSKGSSKQPNPANYLPWKHYSNMMSHGRLHMSRPMQQFLLEYINDTSSQATKDAKSRHGTARPTSRPLDSTREPRGASGISIEYSSPSNGRPLPSRIGSHCLSLRMTDQEVALLEPLLNGPGNAKNPGRQIIANDIPSWPIGAGKSMTIPKNFSSPSVGSDGRSASVVDAVFKPSFRSLDSFIPLATLNRLQSPCTKDYGFNMTAPDATLLSTSNVDGQVLFPSS